MRGIDDAVVRVGALLRYVRQGLCLLICTFGVVVWLFGLGCLDRGASEEVVWVSCSMARFRL